MPEGHTLHRLAQHLQRVVVGQTWQVSSPQGRFAAGAQRLDGRVPQRAEAWGKHLFVHVEEEIWHVHLGLYGAFSFRGRRRFAGESTYGAPRLTGSSAYEEESREGPVVPAAPEGAVRARIQVRDGWADLRGPATCAVLEPAEYAQVTRRLGPDPLREAAGEARSGLSPDVHSAQTFVSNLRRRRVSIGAALMDQQAIAGIGNIYRAESLFCERISPNIPARELAEDRALALWHRLGAQLRDGVAEGRIITLRSPEHSSRDEARRHHVYKHQGTACLRCAATIQARELNGRTLYWCPGCQN